MANHVYSTVHLIRSTNDGEIRFDSVFSDIQDVYGETGLEFSSFLPDQEIVDIEYMEDNVGPRWAKITGRTDDAFGYEGLAISIESEWKSPNKWFEQLGEYLSSYDPDVEIMMTYVDEYYNFAGVYVWKDQCPSIEEQTGVWFKQQLDELGKEPSELPDFIDDEIAKWGLDIISDYV